jgi:hypothetical protein
MLMALPLLPHWLMINGLLWRASVSMHTCRGMSAATKAQGIVWVCATEIANQPQIAAMAGRYLQLYVRCVMPAHLQPAQRNFIIRNIRAQRLHYSVQISPETLTPNPITQRKLTFCALYSPGHLPFLLPHICRSAPP